MGRKQKLRQERKIRNKAAAAAVVVTTTSAEATVVEATSEGILSEEAAMAAPVAAAAKATSEGIRDVIAKIEEGKLSEEAAAPAAAKKATSEGILSRLDFATVEEIDCEDQIIAKIEYHIHNFANREEKKGEHFCTGAIKARFHLWKLRIYPRGHSESRNDAEYNWFELCW